jgi:hypothetical protein
LPPDETVPPCKVDPPATLPPPEPIWPPETTVPPVAELPPVELELAGPEELHAKVRKRQPAILTGPKICRMMPLRVSGAVLRIPLYQLRRGRNRPSDRVEI